MRVGLSVTIFRDSYHFSEADARIPKKHKKAIRKPPYAASIGNKLVVSDKVKKREQRLL
jgi:hypothetical protein